MSTQKAITYLTAIHNLLKSTNEHNWAKSQTELIKSWTDFQTHEHKRSHEIMTAHGHKNAKEAYFTLTKKYDKKAVYEFASFVEHLLKEFHRQLKKAA